MFLYKSRRGGVSIIPFTRGDMWRRRVYIQDVQAIVLTDLTPVVGPFIRISVRWPCVPVHIKVTGFPGVILLRVITGVVLMAAFTTVVTALQISRAHT